jgi:hypothetical protein
MICLEVLFSGGAQQRYTFEDDDLIGAIQDYHAGETREAVYRTTSQGRPLHIVLPNVAAIRVVDPPTAGAY